MKKRGYLIVTVLVLSAVVLGVLFFLPVHGEGEIYDTVVRLHVRANSDSEEDQALKLRVRDEILAHCSPRLAECQSRAEAEETVLAMQSEILAVAQRTVFEEGYDYGVSVTLGEEEYPERTYDSLCFPSGEYLSLRVCIGEAEGKNWWCVLFPPLCLETASIKTRKEAEEAFIAAGFTPEQYKIITETDKVTYRIRFKFLEILEEWFGS